jgi:LacI family transcriptional regulator
VQRLIGHGHRDIGLPVGKDIDPSRVDPRHNGWKTALHEAGLPEGPVEFSDFTRQGGYEATLRLLELPQPPTVIFASSDLLAVQAVRQAGRDIGGSLPLRSTCSIHR